MITKYGKYCDYKIKAEIYGSVNEMVDLLKTRPITDTEFYDQQKKDIDRSWTGVGSYQEALDLLKDGYQPVVKDLKTKLQTNITNDIKRMSFGNDVVGYAPIVPLVLQGVPKNMLNTRMKPIKSKVIDVYYDITCGCRTESSRIIENGKNVLGAIMDLEAQGYKINLYSIQTYSDRYGADVLIIKIKDSKQPFDIKRMSFPLTHTAFFRVIGFDWYSKFPLGKYRSAYGHNIRVEHGEQKSTDIIRQLVGNDKAIVLFGSSISHESQEHIKEMLKDESNNKSDR